jgi:hypothetical protein
MAEQGESDSLVPSVDAAQSPVPSEGATQGRPDDHNTGSLEDKRSAMKEMASYAVSVNTVAVATLAFTVGLINNIHHARYEWALQWGWGLLLGSVLFAFLVIGQYASQLARSIIKPRQGPLEWLLLLAFVCLMVGLCFVTVFGFNNISTG